MRLERSHTRRGTLRHCGVVALVAAIGFAGCRAKESGGPSVLNCPEVVELLMKGYGKTMVSALPFDMTAKYEGKLTEAMTASCRDDRWPAIVGTCVEAAKLERELMECGDHLKTQHYQKRMQARFAPIVEEAATETLKFNKDLAAKRAAEEAAEESD